MPSTGPLGCVLHGSRAGLLELRLLKQIHCICKVFTILCPVYLQIDKDALTRQVEEKKEREREEREREQ